MKVIFLDFDGVLNCESYIRRSDREGLVINPLKMALLKEIIEFTKAKIVLSTSWREHWEKSAENCDEIGKQINEIFINFGLEIFDKTPKIGKREEEIFAWLEKQDEVENFVVLDDAILSADYLDGHFVKTSDYYGGLDATDVKRVIEILSV